MTEHTPVLIVGAGPVGLALAGELGWRGISCQLIEQTDGSIEQPRGCEIFSHDGADLVCRKGQSVIPCALR